MGRHKRVEVILWSIALPGFGQILNGHVVKGLLLIVLEFMVNLKSNLNLVIIASFKGEIQNAINLTDYHWLMFYPCIYMFGIWDAYREVSSELNPYSYLPFVTSAFVATVGLIYSSWRICGILWGPVWLPMLFCFIGLGIGFILKKWFLSLMKDPVEN
ncbi:hypothetical protein [Paenibacillus eucommiae]|uniref:Uncharacterized protein n=1 Tax=Paenibacillus eucommiae TaxID=1355755 RepID=A0ABS4IR24_9BACL|nr:hypothetical protein [Paenibacillus eucommiae]MBP1990021.1 hypothetical protein [Paenibacillus eucommiae]